MRITFNVVKERAKKSGVCSECGKKRSRTKVFEQTLNPWNKSKDGNPKTPDEIRAELRAEVKTWLGEAFICASCDG